MTTPITAHRVRDLRPAPVTTIPPERYRRFHEPAPQPALCLDLDLAPTGTHGPVPLPEGLPEPGAWTATIVTAVLEAMQGRRSATQLQRYLSPEIARRVVRRGEVSARRRLPFEPVTLRGVRAVPTLGGAVEAGMLAVTGDRNRAVAVRLEAHRDRWVMTELVVG